MYLSQTMQSIFRIAFGLSKVRNSSVSYKILRNLAIKICVQKEAEMSQYGKSSQICDSLPNCLPLILQWTETIRS